MKKLITFWFVMMCIIVQSQITPTNGIVYVKPDGNGNGSSWASATSDLHNAILTNGVQKVFAAIGNYNVGSSSFIMKNGVEIYGGFDPANGITNLSHNRILPNKGMGDGSVLNGQNERPVIWNVSNGVNTTAILDGFTITEGKGNGGGIHNEYASPTLSNLVIKGNTGNNNGGGMYNYYSSPVLTNVIIKDNTAYSVGGMWNSYSSPILTNVQITGNSASYGAGGFFMGNYSGNPTVLTNVLIAGNSVANYLGTGAIENPYGGHIVLNNVTIANNITNGSTTTAINGGGGSAATINNSVIYGSVTGTSTIKYSLIEGRTAITDGNLNATGVTLADIFTNPSGGNYTIKFGSPAVNAGSNALYTGLNANTKDLAGNPRVHNFGTGIIDLGAYESSYTAIVLTNGIVYVKPGGTGNGSSWNEATDDLHNAILTNGVQKVFAAIGNYNVGSSSFIMKNGVEIYGGFDPANGITDLSHNRIMPNPANTQGSVLNGENTRPVIWNVFTSGTAMNTTAVLDGFTVFNGSYSNGAGIRNIYASPTLRNLVIRGNTSTGTGAGIYNENSNPNVYNTVISGNTINAPYNQSGIGSGIYNHTNSAPTIVNTTIVNNTINGIGASPVMVGAGVANLSGAAPKIYNSIIWNNQKNGVANTAGADIENNNATITLKNSITQLYNTGNSSDNNKVNENPVFTGTDFKLQATSPAINSGSNALFTGLNANTKDLAGNPRLGGSSIDMGAYEYTLLPDNNGIIYIRNGFTGKGTSWADATGDLHNAIHASGVQKVFVASGNYNVGDHSFIMKNNVEIYGGFDPANGITTLAHNRIMPNAANTQGSVLNGQNVRPVVWNEFTEQNQLYSTAVLDGFTIMNGLNTDLKGAGIYNFGASPTLRNLVLRNNVMTNLGAALYNVGGNAVVTNVSIINNTGRGVVNSQSSPQFTNVLISGNTGAGVYNWGNNYIHIGTYTNVTIANNGFPFEAGAYSHFKNSILWDDINGYDYGGENNLIKGNVSTANGNLNTSLMVPTDIFTDYANGDYTLKSSSPAVDKGDNALFTGLNTDTKDLAGNTRLFGSAIDMGAYEFQPMSDANGIVYVKPAATGSGNGTSWNDATSDLHNAIHATGVQKVFVAIGNYNVGDHSFIMKNGVEIYGGFNPNNNIVDLDDERILPNRGTAEGSVLNGQNVRPVIWNVFNSGTALNNSAVLDGFTVMNGDGGNSSGGGINNKYASPTLRNLVVKNNINTTINSSTGGGIKNDYSSPVITNTIIKGNTATIGSAMANVNSSPVLTNVLITGNTATHPTDNFKETVHTDNRGIYTNVTIAGNNGKPLQGGGGTAQYSNVIAIGNTGTFYSSHVKNSIITGNTDLTNGNIDATGVTLTDIFNDPTNGDYTLKNGSVAVNAGSNALFPNLDVNTKDLAGNPRVHNFANGGIIDLGAYEYQLGGTIWKNTGGTPAWSNGTPDNTMDAVIDADYNEVTAFEAKNLTVNSGKTLTVNSYVKVIDVVRNSGTIEVSNGAGFVQEPGGYFDAKPGSHFNVNVTTQNVKRLGYISWSSPVADSQNLKDFSKGNNPASVGTVDSRFYTYNSADGIYNVVSNPSATPFTPLTGYLIRTPNDFQGTAPFYAAFKGTEPNNGSYFFPVSATASDEYVFTGNPYPGALDINKFFADYDNSINVLLTGTMYIWNSKAGMNVAGTEYIGDVYYTHSNGGWTPNTITSTSIAAGQGFFFVKPAAVTGNISFKNSMRETTAAPFFKSASVDRFWVELKSAAAGTISSSQVLLGFHQQATAGYDAGWDAKIMQMSQDVMYTTVDNNNLVIDIHGNFVNTDKFFVNVNTSAAGSYNISLAGKDGVFNSGQKIYIKDNVTGITGELSQGTFNFVSNGGVEPNRFEISFVDNSVLATQEAGTKDVEIYGANSTVYVKADKKIKSVKVYDLSGRLIKSVEKTNGNSVEIPVSAVKMVLVSVEMADGKIISQKIKL